MAAEDDPTVCAAFDRMQAALRNKGHPRWLENLRTAELDYRQAVRSFYEANPEKAEEEQRRREAELEAERIAYAAEEAEAARRHAAFDAAELKYLKDHPG